MSVSVEVDSSELKESVESVPSTAITLLQNKSAIASTALEESMGSVNVLKGKNSIIPSINVLNVALKEINNGSMENATVQKGIAGIKMDSAILLVATSKNESEDIVSVYKDIIKVFTDLVFLSNVHLIMSGMNKEENVGLSVLAITKLQ